MLETFNIFIIFALGSNIQCCGFKQKCWNCRFIFEPHAEARAERDTVTSETCPLHSAQEVLGMPFCWRSRHRKQINQTGRGSHPWTTSLGPSKAAFLIGVLCFSHLLRSRTAFIWKADLTYLWPHTDLLVFPYWEVLHRWNPEPASFSGDVVIEVMVRVLCSGLSRFTGVHIQTHSVQIIFYNITIVCFQGWMNV